MHCCLYDLRDKEVINSKTACKLGNVCDVEIDSCTGKVVSIIIYGRGHSFSPFCKSEDIRISWENIEVIGEDTILVCHECKECDSPPKKKSFLEGLFR